MTKKNEVAFNISLRQSGLDSLVMEDQEKHTIDVGGTLGTLKKVTVTEGILLEVHGTKGCFRITLPQKYLALIETVIRAEKEKMIRNDGLDGAEKEMI